MLFQTVSSIICNHWNAEVVFFCLLTPVFCILPKFFLVILGEFIYKSQELLE